MAIVAARATCKDGTINQDDKRDGTLGWAVGLHVPLTGAYQNADGVLPRQSVLAGVQAARHHHSCTRNFAAAVSAQLVGVQAAMKQRKTRPSLPARLILGV